MACAFAWQTFRPLPDPCWVDLSTRLELTRDPWIYETRTDWLPVRRSPDGPRSTAGDFVRSRTVIPGGQSPLAAGRILIGAVEMLAIRRRGCGCLWSGMPSVREEIPVDPP